MKSLCATGFKARESHTLEIPTLHDFRYRADRDVAIAMGETACPTPSCPAAIWCFDVRAALAYARIRHIIGGCARPTIRLSGLPDDTIKALQTALNLGMNSSSNCTRVDVAGQGQHMEARA